MSDTAKEIRIAVVIVHGVGFQQPFDTLDKLVHNLTKTVSEAYNLSNVHATIRDFPPCVESGGYTSDFWERNFFEVTARGADGVAFRFPVLEVYWGHRRDTEIDEAKGRRWAARRLLDLDRAALYRCKERTDPDAPNYTALRILDPTVDADRALIGPRDRLVAPRARRFAAALLRFADAIPFPKVMRRLVTAVYGHFLDKVRWQDVVSYITADPQNPLYRVRGEILDEVETRIADIAKWALNSKEGVDAVVFAGHSLGSVILVDTINRMRQHERKHELLAKLEGKTGIIFFGSPVEHILRLIVLRMRLDQPFKNATTINRIAWRLRETFIKKYRDEGAITAGASKSIRKDLFANVPVLNFYAHADPISSEITALRDVVNVACHYNDKKDAHGAYWEDTAVYKRIFTELQKCGVFPKPSGPTETPGSQALRQVGPPDQSLGDARDVQRKASSVELASVGPRPR